MQRFRSTWFALVGGAFLLALTVSSALGADPVDETDTNRGQAVSGFVHDLIFGEDEPEDEVTDPDEDTDEDVDEDVDEEDEVVTEDAVEHEVTGAEHGACVAAIAGDVTLVGEPPQKENHGGAVSLAARVTCWEEQQDEEATDTEENTDEDVEEATGEVDEDSNGNGNGHAFGRDKAKNEHANRGGGNGRGRGRP
jgi:hypothetical protein